MIFIKEKLPEVFANTIDKKFTNNSEYSYGANEERKEDIKENSKMSIEPDINQKINKIFTSTNYIYKADVKITTDTEVLIKKVIGKNNKNIITLDNKLIPIDIIKDIEIINKTSK